MNLHPNKLEKVAVAAFVFALVSCAADKEAESAKPEVAKHKSMSERLNEGGGYKQDAEGNWVPKSDKRSSYDSQRDSPYFKGKVEKETYKTGEYAKKSWWGNKEYGKKGYEGNTDGSRFQTTARQDGQTSRLDGKKANVAGPFETNTLERQSARESSQSPIDRPLDARTEMDRGSYKAPSVIDWREQRQMSMEQSRGILGR